VSLVVCRKEVPCWLSVSVCPGEFAWCQAGALRLLWGLREIHPFGLCHRLLFLCLQCYCLSLVASVLTADVAFLYAAANRKEVNTQAGVEGRGEDRLRPFYVMMCYCSVYLHTCLLTGLGTEPKHPKKEPNMAHGVIQSFVLRVNMFPRAPLHPPHQSCRQGA